jgi:Lon protease-like protein
MNDDLAALANFGGMARLFPLPNLVLFPQVMQPLHIFEPRYRQMTEEALAADRLIAMVLLKPGWETAYDDRPDIHSLACLGRIVADQRLDDGRFNILLRGLARIRIVQEVSGDKLYRSARVELLKDRGQPAPAQERALRRELGRHLPVWLKDHRVALEQLQQLLTSDQPLHVLCDIIAFALPLDAAVKQKLLETLEVEERARLLLGHLDTEAPAAPPADLPRKYPPEFSAN